MKITDIYDQYKIMPNLRLHMFRVAGVAKIICDNSNSQIDKDSIIKAMLLHDMGNIIKFKLTMFPEFLEPEGLEYWTQVQNEFKQRYGDDEHIATLEIAKEIGVSEQILELLSAVGFGNAIKNLDQDNLAKKICSYSDQRVTPFGVVDLTSRINEGRKRYQENKGVGSDDDFEEKAKSLILMEEQIFKHNNIKPQEVDDNGVEKVLKSNYLINIDF